ncbi:hypothetical protein C942_03403 [Photobacterium marinum]|uniref:Uncharacterized protein n=1 Tax=Photobacterium marinum TaxID=1056511 RepID=L8J879_9GAMM|nr:hypothetical protein C942_03403 [Photobacterium marinum]
MPSYTDPRDVWLRKISHSYKVKKAHHLMRPYFMPGCQ